MSLIWIKCPDCKAIVLVGDDCDLAICEDCGSHPGDICSNCGEIIDLIFTNEIKNPIPLSEFYNE